MPAPRALAISAPGPLSAPDAGGPDGGGASPPEPGAPAASGAEASLAPSPPLSEVQEEPDYIADIFGGGGQGRATSSQSIAASRPIESALPAELDEAPSSGGGQGTGAHMPRLRPLWADTVLAVAERQGPERKAEMLARLWQLEQSRGGYMVTPDMVAEEPPGLDSRPKPEPRQKPPADEVRPIAFQ